MSNEKLLCFFKIVASLILLLNIFTLIQYSQNINTRIKSYHQILDKINCKEITINFDDSTQIGLTKYSGYLLFKIKALDKNLIIKENFRKVKRPNSKCNLYYKEILK